MRAIRFDLWIVVSIAALAIAAIPSIPDAASLGLAAGAGALLAVSCWRVRSRAVEHVVLGSGHLHRVMMQSASDGVVTIGTDGRILLTNPAFDHLFGVETGTLVGTPLADLVPEELRDAHLQGFARYLGTGVRNIPWTGIELPGQRKDGRRVWIEVTFVEAKEAGQHTFTGLVRDVTKRRETEEALRDSEQKLRSVVECSNNAIVIQDHDGRLLIVNPAARWLLGRSSEELIGQSVDDLEAQPLADLLRRGRERTLESRASINGVEQLQIGGRRRAFLTSHTPFLDPEGAVQGAISILADITAENEARSRAERSSELEQLVGSLARTAPTPGDVECAVDLSLERVAEALGAETGTVAFDLPEIFGAMVRRRWVRSGAASEPTEDPHVGALGGERSSAESLLLPVTVLGEIVGYAILDRRRAWEEDEQADVRGWVESVGRCIERSVAENRRVAAENEVREALGRAEQANAAKSVFLANVSHELRTPLAAILGYADLLGRPEVEGEAARSWLEHLERNANHLLAMLDDLLDLSKVEAGQMAARLEPTPIDELARTVFEIFRSRADERMLSVELVFENEIPRSLRTDATRVRQILTNLMSNAVKFTDRGGVVLSLRLEAADDGGSELALSVRDTGIGIPADQFDAVFQPFTQVHRTEGRNYGGTGLGLDLSRRLAELLGGGLSLESELGVGTTVTLHLPVTAEEAADAFLPEISVEGEPRCADRSERRGDLAGSRVLLVEDAPDNQRILRFLLEQAGADVTVASNGAEGVSEALRARQDGRGYSLILMDMQMPVLNGYDATRELREQGVRTPIIALTAFAMSGDDQRCLEAGCDAYLSKPVLPERLYAELERRLRGEPEATRPPAAFELPRELVAAFLDELRRSADEIRAAARDGRADELGLRAHRIAGSAGSYGLDSVTELAKTLDQALRRGAPPSALQPEIDALLDEIERALRRRDVS